MNDVPALKKFGVGQPARRVEDERLLTGGGRYTGDALPAGCLHAALARSPHAHARFTIPDADAVRAMPGVRLVLTAAEVAHLGDFACQAPVPNADGTPVPKPRYGVLADGTVKHVGDAVAFVVADTNARAREAVEALVVDYAPLPAIADLRAAVLPGAPLAWDEAPGNLAFDTGLGDRDKVDAAFASAHRTVRVELEHNRLVTNYLETRAVVAEPDPATGGLTIALTSQGVHGVRDTLAKVLGIAPASLRVTTGDVGGGFGTKAPAYREYALAGEAARRLKRPVRWVSDRSEHFLACAHGRDNVTVAEAALDKRGRFLAMRFDVLGNCGAYLNQYGPYIHYLGATMLTGPYATPLIFARVRGAFTNTVPTEAYRGAGRPEASYTLERLADACARALGMDPAELRRRNFVPPSAMPYATPIGGRTYDTGDFARHMDRALEAADRAGFEARRKAARKAGALRGLGLATYIECTAWGSGEEVAVVLEEDGTATVLSGTQSNGQGHATAYAQFAADHLGLPLEAIRVVQGDTARVATGHGTGGSRSVPVGGVATHLAARDLAGKLKALAAAALEGEAADIDLQDGAARLRGSNRFVALADLARGRDPEARTGRAEFTPPDATYPNGTHVAEVSIDPDTGEVAIERYTVCDDFGVAVNPLLLEGQVHGGIAQGIGQALMERAVYDAEGQLLTATLQDYAVPRAADLPNYAFETRNVPSTTNPLGIKGAGEAGTIGSSPAVMNAVLDALAPAGVTHLDMPATPQRVWAALRAARAARAA